MAVLVLEEVALRGGPGGPQGGGWSKRGGPPSGGRVVLQERWPSCPKRASTVLSVDHLSDTIFKIDCS